MSTVTELDPDAKDVAFESALRDKQVPLRSLVAAANRLTNKKLKKVSGKQSGSAAQAWQEDAWDMHDLVGEERFLAQTLANRMGQARFYVGLMPDDTTEDVEPADNPQVEEVFKTLVDGRFHQIVTRAGVNLFIAGDGFLAGVPRTPHVADEQDLATGITPFGTPEEETDPIANVDLDDLDWAFLSVSEVKEDAQAGTVELDGPWEGKECKADDIILIRVWRPHPRKWRDADSPTRSSLPVLRELVGLTMHVSAQVDSRLAGAGILLVPASADQALRAAAGKSGAEDEESPLDEALLEAMITPISDRSNASAVVPLTVTVPDESIEKFRHISFASELDKEARELRDEAIRRLALGQDCPPELLLGVAGMNHWGAWLVREDVVNTHLEPPLALLCDAVTTEFLWPVLKELGVENHEQYVVWYDVEHLIVRPNRSEDAAKGYKDGVVGGDAYRDALGFDESDAPELLEDLDAVQLYVMGLVRQNPTLLSSPGLDVLLAQFQAMADGTEIPPTPRVNRQGQPVGDSTDDGPSSNEGNPPTTEDDPAEEPA